MSEPIELRPIWMDCLIPARGRQDFGAMVAELLREPPAGRRPYVACNFIATLDGRATVGGSTEPLGFQTDARVLMRMRTFADAVLIGAGTMRVERYDRMLPVPRLRGYREQIGLPEDPLTAIVTQTMDLPWDAGLFTDGHGQVVLATTSSASPPRTQTEVEVLRYDGAVDFGSLFAHLHRERGVESISCEGGPTVLHALVVEGLVDDLFLTQNPVLVGDGERSLMRGALPAPVPAELVWALEAEDEMFTRWRIGRGRAGDG
ncbi:MAG TPA: dihydrofolate reductase family protein [Solirubrobacterales bacterium]